MSVAEMPVPNSPSADLRGVPDFMVAAIKQRRAAEAAAERAAVEHARLARAGSRNAFSVMFTLRLGHEDFAMLQSEAAMRAMPTSALARNLVRCGLKALITTDRPDFADDLDSLALRVRAAARR